MRESTSGVIRTVLRAVRAASVAEHGGKRGRTRAEADRLTEIVDQRVLIAVQSGATPEQVAAALREEASQVHSRTQRARRRADLRSSVRT